MEPAAEQAADTAGLQLALAMAFSVYSFKEYKRLSIGEGGRTCCSWGGEGSEFGSAAVG